MGIVLLPLYLAMLLGFAVGGVKVGWRAVGRARGRLTALFVLALMAAGLAALVITLPFAFVAARRVSAGGFAIVTAVSVGMAAILDLLSPQYTSRR